MADTYDAQSFLGSILQGIPNRPQITYPNVKNKTPGVLPRLVVQVSTISDDTPSLDGRHKFETTEMVVNIEVAEGIGEKDAVTLSRTLVGSFPSGLSSTDGVKIVGTSKRPPIKYPGYISYPVIIQARYITAA